ncbi:MAG: RHS repeat-associated core domain-containing protein [Bacteroidota bacterium]
MSNYSISTSLNDPATAEILQRELYYPFGMALRGTAPLVPEIEQEFLYNNKELVGETGLYAYGFRYYDPAIGRFTGVDPISDQFAWVSPFNYAENMPIIGIDLHGLQLFVIHGTREDKPSFSQAAISEFLRISGNTYVDDEFKWDAPQFNGQSRRKHASENLARYIYQSRIELLEKGIITEDEPVTILGYSHGGNLGIQTTRIFGNLERKLNLITVSTPAFNTNWKDAYGYGGNIEDPMFSEGINDHIHIVHEDDNVARVARTFSGHRKYNNPDTRNIIITDEDVPINFGLGITPHTELPSHPDFPTFLKGVAPLKPAPAPNFPKPSEINNEN